MRLALRAMSLAPLAGLAGAIDRIRSAFRGGVRTTRSRRCAGVYLRGADLLVHGQSRTVDGVWILSEPITAIEAGCSDGALGRLVRAALAASRSGVPRPKVWTGMDEPLLEAARVRSYEALVDGAWYVSVDERGGSVTLIPTRNRGARRGFADDRDAASVVPATATDEALGEAVRAALGRSA